MPWAIVLGAAWGRGRADDAVGVAAAALLHLWIVPTEVAWLASIRAWSCPGA